jgi:hypothetical protein
LGKDFSFADFKTFTTDWETLKKAATQAILQGGMGDTLGHSKVDAATVRATAVMLASKYISDLYKHLVTNANKTSRESDGAISSGTTSGTGNVGLALTTKSRDLPIRTAQDGGDGGDGGDTEVVPTSFI